jgi:hypothetical protein
MHAMMAGPVHDFEQPVNVGRISRGKPTDCLLHALHSIHGAFGMRAHDLGTYFVSIFFHDEMSCLVPHIAGLDPQNMFLVVSRLIFWFVFQVIKVQFFTPCALPGRYNCLDLVGPNLDVRPCRCDAHEAHVLRMIGEETRFLAPNGSIKVDAEPAAGQLDEREIRLSNRKSFGLVQETEHDWERRQKVYKNMTAKIERNFNTLKAESGLKKLESSISVLKYLKRVRQPVTRCKNEARVGSLGDGGKWVCNPEAIKKSNDCLVYSVGSNEEYFFEEAIHR